jgi:hypothetical protein
MLHDLVYPYAQSLHLTTLPAHIHEVLLSCAFYTAIQTYVSPYLSQKFVPQYYSQFSRRTRVNWDIHFTSFIQSLIICSITIYVMRNDTERIGETWQDRVYGYSGAAGLVQALAAGYFMWDVTVCIVNYSILGPADLLHAVIAISGSMLGFRPFGLYYGPGVLLFELSTPFVNIHWACDKVGMTGSRLQWWNGVVLIAAFFSCRLVWGSYLIVNFFKDVWVALQADREFLARGGGVGKVGGEDAVRDSLPLWVAVFFFVGNLGLTGLNFYWFSKMIEAVRKRFRPQEGGAKENGAAHKSSSGKVKVR